MLQDETSDSCVRARSHCSYERLIQIVSSRPCVIQFHVDTVEGTRNLIQINVIIDAG